MDLIMFLVFLLAVGTVATNIAAIYWFGSMLIPLVAGGAPYVPTRPNILRQMIELARITDRDVVVDLGSGDGRLVIASLNAGARRAIGYEIHPGLARLSRRNIRRAGYNGRAKIINRSMWKADLSDATVILLYQIPYAMKRFRKRLLPQLTPGTRIVSHAFTLPGREPDERRADAMLYTVN